MVKVKIGRSMWFAGALSLVTSSAFAQTSAEGCTDVRTNPLTAVSDVVTKPILPSCKADMNSKNYPRGTDGSRTWWGARRVEVSCEYTCRSENLPPVKIRASRTVSIWGSEAGWELACYGIPYEQRYNNYRGWFVYVPMEPKYFSPSKSDVKELKEWAEGKRAR